MVERLKIAGVALLVLVAIVVAVLALRHPQAAPPSSDLGPGDQRSVEPTTADQSGPSATRSAGPTGFGEPTGVEDPTFLAIAEDASLIRATRGSCRDGRTPVIEVSADRGASFTETPINRLTQVLRVEATGRGDFWVIGADDQCRVWLYETRDSGRRWDRADATGYWHLSRISSEDRVHAPGRAVETPCAPVSLSTVDSAIVRVLCRNGAIVASPDQGRSWITLGARPGARSIRFVSTGVGFAAGADGECGAAVVRTADGGASWEGVSCLSVTAKPRAVAAANESLLAAQIGGTLHLSSDAGATWDPT